jgi:hypothetical protein
MADVRWLLIEQDVLGIPVPVLLGGFVLAVPAFHEFRPVRAPSGLQSAKLILPPVVPGDQSMLRAASARCRCLTIGLRFN